LQWYHGLGNATVKGTFQKGRKAFDFKITTLQAILLVQFNTIAEGDQLSFHQLADCTGMPEEVLKRVVHSLACAKEKVLKKISVDPSSSDKIIRDTDSFKVNDGYSSQMRAVRIPMASLDETHNTKRVEEDRSVAIEACIVRIMKARKTLGHEQLVAEVLAQLHFFRPERKVIKQRIENLIERDYLEREDRATYKYMA
jgi:cullin 1